LEKDAESHFFRGATFLFCEAAQRFTHATIVCASVAGQDVALALCNHPKNRRLWLHESGDPAWDQIFIEYNGILLHHDYPHALAPVLAKLVSVGEVRLSGVTAEVINACQGLGTLPAPQARIARILDLTALPHGILPRISANSRAQIARAMHLAGDGVTFTPANSPDQANEFLERLMDLHQSQWRTRGARGAFADPNIRGFHHALVARGFATCEIIIARVASENREIGYLYYLVSEGRVMAYQSGLTPSSTKHDKPGLIAHVAAIDHFAKHGYKIYDFLAGDAQYKRTLAPDLSEILTWATLYPPGSLRGAWLAMAARVKKQLRQTAT